ncbi:MAG TPA: hypothetical protein PLV42_05175 [bacterium]|nr:hypothetical protein [bacterium]
MSKYGVIVLFAAFFLIACDNNIKSKNDTAPQNDEAAVTDDDTAQNDEQNDGALIDDVLPDGAQPDEAQPDGAFPDSAQPDDALPDGAQPDDTVPDEAQSDDTVPDDVQPDTLPTDDGMPDEDAAYPTVSSITYDHTVEPWGGGANILEGEAVIVTLVGEPPDTFVAPQAFVASKSFIDVNIYREANSSQYVRVRLSRTQVGTTFPATVTLQPPLAMTTLNLMATISQAEWFDGAMVYGYLTGELIIDAFNEGAEPGATTTLIFSGNDLTFTPTN